MTIEKVTVDNVEIFRETTVEGDIDFEVDYTDFASRIADVLDGEDGINDQLTTIATNSTSIATSLATIAAKVTLIEQHQAIIAAKHTLIEEHQDTIATKHTAIEDYQKTMRDLAIGTGIHMVGPYELFGYAALFRLLVDQGDFLKKEFDVSEADKVRALAALKQYVAKLSKDLPREF